MGGAYDAVRAQLDALMGHDRDGGVELVGQRHSRRLPLHERARHTPPALQPEMTCAYADERVCSGFLFGVCLNDVFANTKLQRGACAHLHSEFVRDQFMRDYKHFNSTGTDARRKSSDRDVAAPSKLLQHERVCERACQELVNDVERRIAKRLERLRVEYGISDEPQTMLVSDPGVPLSLNSAAADEKLVISEDELERNDHGLSLDPAFAPVAKVDANEWKKMHDVGCITVLDTGVESSAGGCANDASKESQVQEPPEKERCVGWPDNDDGCVNTQREELEDGEVEEAATLALQRQSSPEQQRTAETREEKDNVPANQMRVCDVCSGFLSCSARTAAQIDSHFSGRLHHAFLLIRKKLVEIAATRSSRQSVIHRDAFQSQSGPPTHTGKRSRPEHDGYRAEGRKRNRGYGSRSRNVEKGHGLS
ncbi:hypothetical protein FVE85_2105 [Porphyridium purpureum]|uniref:Luc7-like protein 3 n=1 Tax=Porphyridium purpureum TaxID=35688 RepID=A0A5J4YY99_PORPP|nr:hypothetical protein FVE85_2105 [Porphyridium purpureum]|eukprot:POR2407..scf209_3